MKRIRYTIEENNNVMSRYDHKMKRRNPMCEENKQLTVRDIRFLRYKSSHQETQKHKRKSNAGCKLAKEMANQMLNPAQEMLFNVYPGSNK